MSVLSLFFYLTHLSNTRLTLMFKAHQKICNPLLWIHLHSLLNQPHVPFPLFLCSLCNNWPPILPGWLYMSRNRRVGECAHQHVCNTNNIHHTVQMAVPLSLWLLQFKVNRGRAYARPSVCVTQHRIRGTIREQFSISLFSINHSCSTQCVTAKMKTSK